MPTFHGLKLNSVSCRMVDTPILGEYLRQRIKDAGMEFGTVESAVQAAFRISCEPTINGKEAALKVLTGTLLTVVLCRPGARYCSREYQSRRV